MNSSEIAERIIGNLIEAKLEEALRQAKGELNNIAQRIGVDPRELGPYLKPHVLRAIEKLLG